MNTHGVSSIVKDAASVSNIFGWHFSATSKRSVSNTSESFLVNDPRAFAISTLRYGLMWWCLWFVRQVRQAKVRSIHARYSFFQSVVVSSVRAFFHLMSTAKLRGLFVKLPHEKRSNVRRVRWSKGNTRTIMSHRYIVVVIPSFQGLPGCLSALLRVRMTLRHPYYSGVYTTPTSQ